LRNVTVTQLAGNEILVANGMPPSAGEMTCVETGLSPGDVIVTDGVDKLVQGAKVQASKPTGTHGGGGSGQPATAASADAAGTSDPANADAGAAGGTWHHHHAASGPADNAEGRTQNAE
jgi:multidrug efflux system membrane fusion protein